MPIPPSAAAFMLVRTGDGDHERAGRPLRAAASAAASRAACIIFRPPEACTLTIHTPSDVAAATAPATVFGMSWNFRSRNTRSPRPASSADDRRSFGGEEAAADLESAGDAAQSIRERQSICGAVHIEGNQELIHACSFFVVSRLPVSVASDSIP